MHKRLSLTLIIVCIVLSISTIAIAKDIVYGNVKVSRVTKVYDGDTFAVDINEFPAIVGKDISIRIYGIDTPEMKSGNKAALEAKKFVEYRLSRAKKIILRNIRRGKYFRIVAEVYLDGESLGDMLLKAGLAKRYYGGEKSAW